jgi:pimeloyl-ACP methyl ester carboxylesterase
MAADAVALLDHLELSAAQVVGASMGGMIAQLIAIRHPDRVLSLVSIMSSTGNQKVGGATLKTRLRLLRRAQRERERYIKDHVETFRLIGSPGFDFDEERTRERAARCFDRGVYPAGGSRQLAAVVTAPDRTAWLAQLRVPTTVIHGDADPPTAAAPCVIMPSRS